MPAGLSAGAVDIPNHRDSTTSDARLAEHGDRYAKLGRGTLRRGRWQIRTATSAGRFPPYLSLAGWRACVLSRPHASGRHGARHPRWRDDTHVRWRDEDL